MNLNFLYILSGQHLPINKFLRELGFQHNKSGLSVQNGKFFSNDISKEVSINENCLTFSAHYENRSTAALWARNLLEFLERSMGMELNTSMNEVQ